jgi:squalene-associated FAD-dependent desaturase
MSEATPHSSRQVTVVGGGLAGLAAAVRLARRGVPVTILESRQRLGGRASSFIDPATGQMIDTCQHVSMGCCNYLADFYSTIGVRHFLATQPCLWFLTPDRRVSRFAADPWPAPFHLGRALAGLHYLTATEKLRIAAGLVAMLAESPEADPPLFEWLLQHRQTCQTIRRFWAVVLVSALNESVDRLGFKYARKVFVDAFLSNRHGWQIQIPTVPLGRLYGEELRSWLGQHHVTVRENARVRELVVAPRRAGVPEQVTHLRLQDGSMLPADEVILAVPVDRCLELLPASLREKPDGLQLEQLQTSPITSVHLWYDRPITRRPHLVLVDCQGQWLFNRGPTRSGEHYYQVVISAAHKWKRAGHEVVVRAIHAELQSLLPAAIGAKLLRFRAVTEHAATFSPVPGVDRYRPSAATSLANLTLAGDWTATGWPATMEGAVRSGYRAADVVLQRRRVFSSDKLPAEPESNSRRCTFSQTLV